MHRPALLLLSFLAVAPAQAQPPDPQPAPVLSKPRPKEPDKQIVEDIRSFVSSLNSEAGHLWAVNYVADARYGWFGANEWMRYWKDRNTFDDGVYKLRVDDIQIDKIDGDDAQATVSYRLDPPIQGEPDFFDPPIHGETNFKETVQLHRRGKHPDGRFAEMEGFWGIVVGAPEEVLKQHRFSLERIALFIKQPPGIVTQIRAEESLDRLRKLSLAALMFIQDNDDFFAFGPEYFQEALLPYTKTLRNYIVPGTGVEEFTTPPPSSVGERYSFNAHLSGRSSNRMGDTARTVLFYDGKNKQLTFRYNGRAAVGFLDGHAALVDAEAAKTLLWEP